MSLRGSIGWWLALASAGVAWGQGLSVQIPGEVRAVGAFEVAWEGDDARGSLRICRGEQVVWASPPGGQAFLVAARGEETIRQTRHSYRIQDRREAESDQQTIDAVRAWGAGGLELGGVLDLDGTPTRYRLRLEPLDAETLRFEVGFEAPTGGLVQALTPGSAASHARANRIRLRFASAADERLYGLGTQFTHLEVKGHRVPIWVQEQGQGRGKQPITWIFNVLGGGLGGDAYTTYTAVPLLLSNRNVGLLIEDHPYMEFDLREAQVSEVEAFADRLQGRLFAGRDPLHLLEVSSRATGRMQPLPDWMHTGAVIGTVGGAEWVRELSRRLDALDAPVSAWFLQDWVGERSTAFGKRLVWNWIPERSRYGDLRAFTEELGQRGERMLGYINPFLVDVPDARRNLFAEARDAGYLVRNPAGEPYMIGAGGFASGLVDLTHPEARAWLKQVIREEMLGNGLAGWMSDFCEQLPYDAVLHAGDARTLHNRYPELFQALQREALAEAGASDVVFFARSGTFRSPGIAPLFWLGDQMTTWDRQDGMFSALIGQLSSGLSGYTLNHADVGGYLSPQLFGLPILHRRSQELMIRWMELGAFTPVFRTHDANSTGTQFHSNDEVLGHFARNAKLFASLFDYRRELMQEAATRGAPLTRPLWLHAPDDPLAWSVEDAFLLGPDLLVAPVLLPRQRMREVYLPRGTWRHVWSGRRFELAQGQRVRVACPLGQPPAFVRAGSPLERRWAQALSARGLEHGLERATPQ